MTDTRKLVQVITMMINVTNHMRIKSSDYYADHADVLCLCSCHFYCMIICGHGILRMVSYWINCICFLKVQHNLDPPTLLDSGDLTDRQQGGTWVSHKERAYWLLIPSDFSWWFGWGYRSGFIHSTNRQHSVNTQVAKLQVFGLSCHIIGYLQHTFTQILNPKWIRTAHFHLLFASS